VRDPVHPCEPESTRLRVVVATRNDGKAREFGRLLGEGFVAECLPSSVELPEETGETFAENARLKAVGAYRALGRQVAVLADDSGLEVDALSGAPGVRSARFAGHDATDEANVSLLLQRLDGVRERGARFVCALVLLIPSGGGGEPLAVDAGGELQGRIADEPAGTEGFGYDPVFVPKGWSQTLGQAGPSAKDSVSHRGRAVYALLQALGRQSRR
jgi:XTP/dITP diphosphohydrolase